MNTLLYLSLFAQCLTTHGPCPQQYGWRVYHPEPLPAEQFGVPDLGTVYKQEDYLLGYDGSIRTARWTLEKLTRTSLIDRVERNGQVFRADDRIPDEYRPSNRNYLDSKYERGHLARASWHRQSAAALRDTFTLANVAPQLPGFNKGCWKQLEDAVTREAQLPEVSAVFVLTGPLYLAKDHKLSLETIGPDDMPVPTHFFKSLLVIHADGEIKAVTIVLPHSEWQARGAVLEAFDKYRVSVDWLEEHGGFNAWSAIGEGEAELEAAK